MKNKKLTRGLIAGVLGLALLLGGGTFALWYQSSSISSGPVNSGALSYTTGASVWTNETTSTTISDITAYQMVPGDTVKLVVPLTIKATGSDLKATLKVDWSALVCPGSSGEFCTAVKASPQTSFGVTGLTSTTINAGTGGYELTSADDAKVASVTVTLHFPTYTDGDTAGSDRSNWWGQAGQTETIDLTSVKFDLAQHL